MALRNEVVAFAPRQSDQGEALLGQSAAERVLGSSLASAQSFRGDLAANQNVRKGVIEGFVRTCERWRLSRAEQVILLGYRGSELAAQPILLGRLRPSLDVLDRTGYALGISIGLAALYDNSVAAELGWLTRPHAELAGETPMNVMLRGRMTDMMRVHNLVLVERAV